MNSSKRNDFALFFSAGLTLLGSATVFALAVVELWRGNGFFRTWFYVFAWWSYLLFAEAWLYVIRGDSVLFTRPKEFLSYLPVSVSIWLVFELINFRLQNWHYVNLPSSLVVRWLGYCVSFATVIPGLFVTRRIVDRFGLFAGRQLGPIHFPSVWPPVSVLTGTAFLTACLVWPRYAFPLVWVGFIFLLDPVNDRCGYPSIFSDLKEGEPRRLLQLLASGLICGIFWESWNYWAGSKWIYTLPLFDRPKLFEMPLAGYLGFPPFAVECFVMYQSLRLLADRFVTSPILLARPRLRWLMGFALAAVHVLIFAGMDHFTVISFG